MPHKHFHQGLEGVVPKRELGDLELPSWFQSVDRSRSLGRKDPMDIVQKTSPPIFFGGGKNCHPIDLDLQTRC